MLFLLYVSLFESPESNRSRIQSSYCTGDDVFCSSVVENLSIRGVNLIYQYWCPTPQPQCRKLKNEICKGTIS